MTTGSAALSATRRRGPYRNGRRTHAQIMEVAARVFARNTRSVGVLVPEAAADEAKKEAARGR